MRIPPRALDIGLAAVSAVLTLIALFGEEVAALTDASLAGSRWWVAPLMLVPSAALLFRRTSPLAAIAGVWVPVAVHAQLTGDGGEGLYLVWPAWVSLYALAAYGTRRQLLTGIPLALVCLAVHDLNDPLNWRSAEGAWSAAWWDLVLFVPALVGGVVAGTRRARTLATEKELAEARARAAVAEERARIARELHDVVTHHVNLVVLQATAASGLLDRDPERVREPLRVIERSGREALEEMRRLLGVLRDEDAERPLAPQPGLDDVDRLVESARDTGLAVGLAVSGEPRPLSAGLGLTVYRIVQEALTNARKHAVGAHVFVRVVGNPDEGVTVTVRNPVRVGALGMPVTPGAGLGLVGLRERAELAGGSLSVDENGSSFTLRGWLPWTP